MGVRRYVANKDTTITNAFKANLIGRGTGSNMGESDILEIFSIYAQANTASSEFSRVLIQHPISDIVADRANGLIPVSGNVDFYLRLYNAKHSETVPRQFTAIVSPISQSWQEGIGLDMEDYSDRDEANWVFASDTNVAASASIIITQNSTDVDINLTASTNEYIFRSVNDSTGPTELGKFHIGSNTADAAVNLAAVINASASSDFSASALQYSNGDYSTVVVYASSAGIAGNNYQISSSGEGSDGDSYIITGSANGLKTFLTGGALRTAWTNQGGDYYSGKAAGDTQYQVNQYYDSGVEDLEINITHIVEDWIRYDKNDNVGIPNYGLGIRLHGDHEDETRSYYTKRFFARGTQFFYKKPIIEARFNDAKADDTANFYLSSALAPAHENINNIYLYNYVRGRLQNIPSIGSGSSAIYVSLYSGSATSGPTGSKLAIPGSRFVQEGNEASYHVNVTGVFVSKGIYSASFAYNSSSISTIYPVWHTSPSNIHLSASGELHTGSMIAVKNMNSLDYNPTRRYVCKITNLKPSYRTDEEPRLRLYTRQKEWSPNIYTVASTEIENSIIENAYYKVYRIADGWPVIEYGTGSAQLEYSKLSYDASGSYFDLNMSLFEKGYMYGIKFIFDTDGYKKEQPELFKFRVED